jgi:hypothetical protein
MNEGNSVATSVAFSLGTRTTPVEAVGETTYLTARGRFLAFHTLHWGGIKEGGVALRRAGNYLVAGILLRC